MRNILKLILVTSLFLEGLTVNAKCANTPAQPHDSVYSIMKKVADWQWQQLENKGWKKRKTDWTNGVMYTGMMACPRENVSMVCDSV